MSSRFELYCQKKTNAALSARLPGFTTVDAREVPTGMAAVGNEWSRRLFDGWFYRTQPDDEREIPALSLVFVQSADGNTGADDPGTLGGGETDKHLVYEGLSRVDADAVLAGATTVAGDEIMFSVWHPEMVRLRLALGRSRHPVQIVVTRRGELPVENALLYGEPSLTVVVITSPSGASRLAPRLTGRPWIALVDAGSSMDLRAALRELYRRGIRVISAVGGRRTAEALLQADAVSELYLTTAARRGGEPGTPLRLDLLSPHQILVDKQGLGEDHGVRFQHLVKRR
jgi:riboflavin biosynthesis pyrimidine reductase